LVGVQGCGKSLAAKFVARAWSMPLLKLDAGRLYDKYIGESEKNFRHATTLAQSMAPAVLWVDEIEKGFIAAGSGEADGGLGRRLLGSFLTWLQERRADVFVVATANDLTLLPPELLRKGRFDEIFFVDLPDAAEREMIFRIHLSLRKQDSSALDLPAVIEASKGFSGAEIEQAVIGGLYRALHAKVRLSTALLLEEITSTVPLSVSRREDIDRLRAAARQRFVPVRG
jgi:SpoVK/Ycf46/Vps4 family AAA+-type ATPase